MASSSHIDSSKGRRMSQPLSLVEVDEMKARIKDLEKEVANYKRRLDELRKAKSQTYYKFEREMVHVKDPIGRPNNDVKLQIEEEVRKLKKCHDNEIADLKAMHKEELQNLREDFLSQLTSKKELPSCNHQPILDQLNIRVSGLYEANSSLKAVNIELEDRVQSLVQQLSVKEAEWCTREEELKQKLQQSWGEKYLQWMTTMEGRIAELQQTNDVLRELLTTYHVPTT